MVQWTGEECAEQDCAQEEHAPALITEALAQVLLRGDFADVITIPDQ